MTIPFDEFQKIELRVVSIFATERVEGSEKLLKLTVDVGSEHRTIVAGIGRRYAPEELVGLQIAVVANLEPRTMMGIESQGMILACDDDTGAVLLRPSLPVPPGSKLH